jgi:hypothetical protein
MVKRGRREEWYAGAGAIPDARLREIQKELGIGFWSARFSLYGPEELIELNFRRVKEVFDALGEGFTLVGRKFLPPQGKKYLSPEDMPPIDRTVETGTPSLMALKAVEYRGVDGGHISFSPVLPPSGKAAVEFYHAVRKLCAAHGFDYFGGLHLYPRHLTMIQMIYFDRTDEAQRKAANALFRELVTLTRQMGYSEYRAHIDYMDLVAEQYDFNGGSLRDMSQRIKDALDPNGILSPGKQGIWPKQYRAGGKGGAAEVVNGVKEVTDKLAAVAVDGFERAKDAISAVVANS